MNDKFGISKDQLVNIVALNEKRNFSEEVDEIEQLGGMNQLE
jgi:hypothetical protein